ncbi:MAG: hypothetical protein ACRDIB_20060 [Ardenticatenaceae bacterium]
MSFSFDLFWRTFGWFGLVWFFTAGLSVILVQFLLPYAWRQIRAQPPHGPPWAHTLWYKRTQVYGALMALSLALGAVAAALFLFGN